MSITGDQQDQQGHQGQQNAMSGDQGSRLPDSSGEHGYQWISGTDGSWTIIPTSARFPRRLMRFFEELRGRSLFYGEQLGRAYAAVGNDAGAMALYQKIPSLDKETYRTVHQEEALARLEGRNTFVCDFSSGSTARCVLRFSSPTDELAEQALTEAAFRRAGMGAGDHFICMEVGVPEIYDFYFRAARNLGVKRTGFLHLTGRYARSVAPLKALNPTVILTIPSILARIWPHVRDFWPPGQAPIKSVIHMGEPMHPALRREVESTWGCRVHSFYGTTEVGGMASSCRCDYDGMHYDPDRTLLTLNDVTRIDDHTMEGEALVTTLHFGTQPVVKYRVADRLRVTTAPCACGETTPRLTFLERTRDAFMITGVKFHYNVILEALRRAAPALRYITIVLEDLSEEEGNTLVTIRLPEVFADQADAFHCLLIEEIFDMEAIHRYGLIRFELAFLPENRFGDRKIRRVEDRRSYLGTGDQAD